MKSVNVYTKQQRIAELARQMLEAEFTSLAYLLARKDGDAGVDEVTVKEYKQDFYDCSYGFRPGRSAHDALEALWRSIMGKGGSCWVLEVNIQSYFDTVKHSDLREMCKKRVRDSVIDRVLGKRLKAGVMEDGAIRYSDKGTPQGGVISLLLSNV